MGTETDSLSAMYTVQATRSCRRRRSERDKRLLGPPRFTSRQYPTIRGIGKDFRIIRGSLVDRGLLHEMHSLRDGGHRWMVPTDQNSASRAAIDIDAVERSRSAENISRHRSRHIDLVLVRGWTPMESGSGRGEHHG